MRVIERFVLGKAADQELCEDAVVVTDGYAAVVDGATDVSGRSYGGVAGGRWAMAACVDAIHGLAPGLAVTEVVRALTEELAGRITPGLSAAERPSASVTIYSAAHRQVWQVGDVGFWHAGMTAGAGQPRKRVDEIAASFRAAVVAAAAAAGEIDMTRVPGPGAGERNAGRADPGREAVRALVGRQGHLRNIPGPYGFAGVDGRPVPAEMVVVAKVPDGVTELVIASDGYPVIGGTLAESESALAAAIRRDPWCVRELAGTKGVLDGRVSFDDRAYLRLGIE